MKKSIDTSCCYTDETMWVSTDEKWLINRIRKLTEKNPGQVTVIKEPEENDGCLYCKLPAKWLQIRPPRKYELTEEKRVAAAERLRNSRIMSGCKESKSEET